MNESAVSKKEIFFIVILMMVIMDVFFFVIVVFYDFSERLTNKKENLVECTVVGFETEKTYHPIDTMFRKHYSFLEDADGNTFKMQRTYNDYVGRKVWVYSDGYTGGLRKDYEIKRMNLFDIMCAIAFPFTIYVIIKVVAVLIKDKKNGK